MMLLCVDGIDPDLVVEFGWNEVFKYNYKLKIPQECFVPDPELGSTPHTTRVWATIFSGQKIDYGLIKREGFRKIVHDWLVRNKITWTRKRPGFTVNPVNKDLDTIFRRYDSFAWNVPTISPEWIATFPGYEEFVEFCKREFWMWLNMTIGSDTGDFEIDAYYTRYVDYMGHNDWKNLRGAYQTVFNHASKIKEDHRFDDVILLSDHGCKDGLHTNYAYFGSDVPMRISSVEDIREALERFLRGDMP